MKINVREISQTWSSCDYKFMVRVEYSFINFNYIRETLCKWFGEAEYFYDNCFLCCKK